MDTGKDSALKLIKYNVICAPGKVKTPADYKFYFEKQYVDTPQRCYREHNHDFFEFFLVAEGSVLHRINGFQETLLPGDLRFILPEDLHRLQMKNNHEYVIYNCNIEAELFQNSFRLLTGGTVSARDLVNKIHLTDTQLKSLRTQFEHIILLQTTNNIFKTRLQGRALIIRVLQHILEVQDTTDIKPEWIDQLCTLMQQPENLMQGVHRLFELSGYTQEHVSRSIRKYLGVTPQQMILEFRLQNVAKELIGTDLSISHIASLNGFGNYAYFHKTFLKRYECTPLQFRKKYYSVNNSEIKRLHSAGMRIMTARQN